MKYDYLIVGAGIYGAAFAYHARKAGKKVLVVERRSTTGGNVHCEEIEGINVHQYGAHIFHTSNKEVWQFVNSFVEFNRYTNSPIANYKGELYNLPFNMNTFHALWGVNTPAEAEAKINEQKAEAVKALGGREPQNLEEQALTLIGRDIFEKLIKGYTEKQWGRKCSELPAFIIKRLPFRLTFDNNYFRDKYQGIPEGGYNKLIDAMLEGIEVRLSTDFCKHRAELEAIADRIVYTGPIDEFYDYRYGKLEYRTVRFDTQTLDQQSFQGNAVVNYTDAETPYTRIIEHKYFEFGTQPKTVISYEYPSEWSEGAEPYYPINNERNNSLYLQYKALADKEEKYIFGGRLAEYKYYDMHQVVEQVIEYWKKQ